MCYFGYLAMRVEEHFLGASPRGYVTRIANGLGVRPRFLEPSGYLAQLSEGAHVVAAFYSGMCACDWGVDQRRPVLELATRVAAASDVAWVKAGFWSIRGDVNDAEPDRAPIAVGWDAIAELDLRQSWLVELRPAIDASATLRETT